MEYNDKQQIYSNYKRQNRFLGIIDYKSLCILIAYMLALGYILYAIHISLTLKIYVYIFLAMPVLAVLLANCDKDSAIDVVINVLCFLLSKKQFVKDLDKLDCNYLKIYIKKSK